MKWPVLQLWGRREHMMTNVQFCLLCPKCWFQFNSRIVRIHFSSIMSLLNWKMAAEMRGHIFRWRSRFRRRRVCLSSLLIQNSHWFCDISPRVLILVLLDLKLGWPGAHQMEPPSPLISSGNPFTSRFINRAIFFCNAVESHEWTCCLLFDLKQYYCHFSIFTGSSACETS